MRSMMKLSLSIWVELIFREKEKTKTKANRKRRKGGNSIERCLIKYSAPSSFGDPQFSVQLMLSIFHIALIGKVCVTKIFSAWETKLLHIALYKPSASSQL